MSWRMLLFVVIIYPF